VRQKAPQQNFIYIKRIKTELGSKEQETKKERTERLCTPRKRDLRQGPNPR
jgi:hypothetical protein